MARDHARTKTTISGDEDWNELSVAAQHLYSTLLPHPTLNYAGVADWRPGRLAKIAKGWTVEDVEAAAEELSAALYVVVDVDTEEILVRSFIRNDEILKQPNVAVAMTKAYAAVGSRTLRGVIVHELQRLSRDSPDLAAWGSKASREPLLELLARRLVDPSSLPPFNPSGNPSGKPRANPKPNPSGNPSGMGSSPIPFPIPLPPKGYPPLEAADGGDASQQAAQPTSEVEARPKRGARIPEDFEVTDHLRDWARKNAPAVDIDDETKRFKRHFESKTGKDGTKLDWNKTWMNWMTNDLTKRRASSRRPVSEGFHAGMTLAARMEEHDSQLTLEGGQ